MYDVFNLTEAKEGVEEDPGSQKCEYRQLNSLSGGWQQSSIFSAKADCSWRDVFHLIIRKKKSFTAHLWSRWKKPEPPVTVENKHSHKNMVARVYM